jgi:hypothetical protein
MEALNAPLHLVRRLLLVLSLGSVLSGASAQYPVIDRLERAFADGAADSVLQELDRVLRDPSRPAGLRFEAWLLQAECWYQRMNLERFKASTDSAAALLQGSDAERRARVEVNRSRHAAYHTQTARAHKHGTAALALYRKAPDRTSWKYAHLIYQAQGTVYRNWPRGADTAFAFFDTARVLLARRPELAPFWRAYLHKAVSNAAMDRMRPGQPDRERFAALCEREQRAALAILREHHPRQVVEIGILQNLRGLYHIYADQPDSAWHWLRRSEELVLASGPTDALLTIWFSSLRWQTFLLDRPEHWLDIHLLQRHLAKLQQAQEHFTGFAAARTQARGLFFHDTYWYSPFASTVTLSARLWELTGDTTYLDRALWVLEKTRRDAWNIAQDLRGRPDLHLDDPPQHMLQAVRRRLRDREAVMVCVEDSRAGFPSFSSVLAVTRDAVSFRILDREFNPAIGSEIKSRDPVVYRRTYHLLYHQLYAPIAQLMQDVDRVRVFPSANTAYIAFDALLADTIGPDITSWQPLVQRHAFSQPLLLLPPERKVAGDPEEERYLAPAPGTGLLTDLKRVRAAMRRWAGEGNLDSSGVWTSVAGAMTGAGVLYLGGHGAGESGRDQEPRHYFGTDTAGRSSFMHPSDLLPLDLQAGLVVHMACQSGFFDLDRNSGPISFARAFVYAGARNVLSTSVPADEAIAIRLVDLFREQLAEGHPTDVALQRAKLAYLQRSTQPEEQLPLHWAGWQLHGEPMAITPPHRSPWPWLMAAAMLLAGLAVLLAWGRR